VSTFYRRNARNGSWGGGAAAEAEVSTYLDYGRDDIGGTGDTKDQAGEKAREVRVFPDAKDGQRPVDTDRNERQEKPDPRQRFDVIDLSPERIG